MPVLSVNEYFRKSMLNRHAGQSAWSQSRKELRTEHDGVKGRDHES